MMHLNAVLGVESKGLLVDVDDEHLPCVASREDVWCRMCMYRMCVRACARARARARARACVVCVVWVWSTLPRSRLSASRSLRWKPWAKVVVSR